MPPSKIARQSSVDQPYPGLRPFDIHDSFLFFGREQHTHELLDRLSHNRFLAVVGTSGSGKSSLVRAGLIPALYRGFLMGATTHWRIAVMRPGGGSLAEMARALASKEALDSDAAEIRKRLEASSLGLVTAVAEAKLAAGESLLLVVDQFEELFRFASESRSSDTQGEALLFVSALLEAVDQFAVPIYVVLTMRTDFLGDCTLFPGLPEALNRSQYLIPRLTREQRRDAIEGPIEIADAEISPRLVQRILNDMGDDPDQLPVMQHALARMYRLWKQSKGSKPLDFEDYEKAGGLAGALNDHAQQIYEQFDPAGRDWTRKLFRCLTKMEKGREIRRAGRLERIFRVVGANDETARAAVMKIVDTYTTEENSLLFLSPAAVPEQRILDIAHESLIRKWKQLSIWVKEEAESAEWACDLLRDTRRQAAGDAGYWSDPILSRVLAKKTKDGWTAAWAEQYGAAEPPGFAGIEAFLEMSRRKQRAQRLIRFAVYGVCALLVLAGLGAAELYRDSEASKRRAEEATRQADEARMSEKAARAELAQSRQERAADIEKQKQLERHVDDAKTDSEKLAYQAQLNAVNTKIVDSLQKENKALSSKLSEYASKTPLQAIVPDATAPLRAQLDQAKLDYSALVAKHAQEMQQAQAAANSWEKKYQDLYSSTRALSPTQTKVALSPAVSTPPSKPPASIPVRLERDTVVRAGDTGVLLTSEFHDVKKFVGLYVLFGQVSGGEVIQPFQHDSKKAKSIINPLDSGECNGRAATLLGYDVACFKIETPSGRLPEGISINMQAQGHNGKRFNLVVKGADNKVNNDKAWLEMTIQPVIE